MKQLEILKIIYSFIKTNSSDVSMILLHLKENNIVRSDRQVKRDIKDVAAFFLNENDDMKITVKSRAHFYQIISKNEKEKLSQKTLNTLSLAMISSPNILIKNRGEDITIFKKLVKSKINKTENKISYRNLQYQIESTNFYEIEKDELFDKNIDVLIEAITTQKVILINKLKNDYTVDNYNQTIEIIEFIPLKIIYHRGAFLVAGFVKTNLYEIVIFEISQLEEFRIRNEKFNYKLLHKTLELELKKRFGITKNIDAEIYDIKLEFTNITGSLVKKYTWHETQKFKLENGNSIMTMKCGINRELLGWIFQWMYNVRILEPQILIDKFEETSKLIEKRQKNYPAFKYHNIFEPNQKY